MCEGNFFLQVEGQDWEGATISCIVLELLLLLTFLQSFYWGDPRKKISYILFGIWKFSYNFYFSFGVVLSLLVNWFFLDHSHFHGGWILFGGTEWVRFIVSTILWPSITFRLVLNLQEARLCIDPMNLIDLIHLSRGNDFMLEAWLEVAQLSGLQTFIIGIYLLYSRTFHLSMVLLTFFAWLTSMATCKPIHCMIFSFC